LRGSNADKSGSDESIEDLDASILIRGTRVACFYPHGKQALTRIAQIERGSDESIEDLDPSIFIREIRVVHFYPSCRESVARD
jgi:hypothetical protein